MEELGKMLNENGECVVENFTVGRKGKNLAWSHCKKKKTTQKQIWYFYVCVINHDLIFICVAGYGSVFLPGELNLTNMNLDDIVHFRRKEVIVYPDDKDKPPVGEGLNR